MTDMFVSRTLPVHHGLERDLGDAIVKCACSLLELQVGLKP